MSENEILIEKIMEGYGWTFVDLVRKANISRKTLWRLRQGKPCRINVAKAISKALRVSIDILFNRENGYYIPKRHNILLSPIEACWHNGDECILCNLCGRFTIPLNPNYLNTVKST